MAKKDNYLFVVNNSSEANPIDWYNGYLEVNFKLLELDQDQDGARISAGTDNVNTFSITTNGPTFIREIQVECNGITVYNITKANESAHVLSLLKYTKEYANTVAKDISFYLDTSTGTAEPRSAQALYSQGYGLPKILIDDANENKIFIPLNIYSYFAAFKNNLHPNLKMAILIQLANDHDIMFRNAATPDSKVLITKFRLWCPKLIFSGAGIKQYLENFLKSETWKYLREHQEIYQIFF